MVVGMIVVVGVVVMVVGCDGRSDYCGLCGDVGVVVMVGVVVVGVVVVALSEDR